MSAQTERDRTVKLAEDITDEQTKDNDSSPGFFIACDESCDVTDIAQIALAEGPQEELIDLLPLTGRTRSENIFTAIITCWKAKEKHQLYHFCCN